MTENTTENTTDSNTQHNTKEIQFTDFGFSNEILNGIEEMGWKQPTDVQKKSFNPVLDGKDVVVQSKTGSGKTGAFGLPLLEALLHHGEGLRAIVMCPTRELAKQVHDDLVGMAKYTKLNFACVYGGVGMEPQIRAIEDADCVVGTPGRILDHMSQGTLDLSNIIFMVLDEADRMLDMGFIDDVQRIIRAMPHDHVTMMFSATMPEQVLQIAETMMVDPVHIKLESFVSDLLLKQYMVRVSNRTKLPVMLEIMQREKPQLAIVFTATRGLCDHVAEFLASNGIEAKPIHGGHTQAKREKVLEGFHAGKVHVLVATDVAARGLDIDNITHIFNYNVPKTPQEYTHHMGRTARAGKDGKVVTLLSPTEHEEWSLVDSYFRGKIEEYPLGEFVARPVNIPKRDGSTGGSGGYQDRGPRREGHGSGFGGGHGHQSGGAGGQRRDGPQQGGFNRGPRRDSNGPRN